MHSETVFTLLHNMKPTKEENQGPNG